MNDGFNMLVAHNLEAVMRRKGSNPAEVARWAGINPTGVYDILSGKSRSPRMETLAKIAAGLGVPINVFFSDPADDALDQELIEAIGMMSPEERRRFLLMARAFLDRPK